MDSVLTDTLERSRQLGFLGPGAIEDQIEHSRRFGSVLAGLNPGPADLIADIGAGGGVPSLPVLVEQPGLNAVLLDASQKRCSFLVWACAQLALSDRVEVWCGRVEDVAHQDRARARFAVVVARGFGPPAITAECASGLLAPGGHLLVSEPPDGREWPTAELARISLQQVETDDPGFALFRMGDELADDYPRPFKVQQRQPLF